VHDVPEDTCQIKKQTKANACDIREVFHKYTEVHQETADSKADQEEVDEDRNGIKDIPADRNPPDDEHSYDDHKGDHHFKCIHTHSGNQKDIFWYIYFGNNCLIFLDEGNALYHITVKKVPHRDTDEDEHREILFFGIEDFSKDKGVDQHETKRFENPPEPVQIRIGDLRLQLSL
jgi:hypothetical protein